jgi:hypothetical protein
VVSGPVIGVPVVGQTVADNSIGLVVVFTRVETVLEVIDKPGVVKSEVMDSMFVPIVDTLVWRVLSEDDPTGVVGEVN